MLPCESVSILINTGFNVCKKGMPRIIAWFQAIQPEIQQDVKNHQQIGVVNAQFGEKLPKKY